MTSLYLRLGAYTLAALLFGSIGWFINGDRWQAKYEALQAGDAQARADAEGAVRKALQAQIDDAQAVSALNNKVIHDLQAQSDAVAAQRDVVTGQLKRLLTAQARSTTPSGDVPQALSQPGTVTAGPTPGDGRIAELLGDAIAECRGNSRIQNALIQEITPQLAP